MSKKLLFRLVVLLAAMMCALGTAAAEAYACYTSSNTTLTFYYDTQRSSRTGKTFDLNTGLSEAGWHSDATYASVTNVVLDPSFADARPTTTHSWFYGMNNLQSITGLSYLNTSKVTSMGFMFAYCSNLTSLDLSSFNTSQVTLMYSMFNGCSSLTSLDLSSFNTSQVTNMYWMFYGCSSLTSLDLGSFNTFKVTNMQYMFSNSSNLRTIYVGNGWNTAAVTNSSNMFENCTSLVGGMGTTYDANHVDMVYARIDGGPNNPGYFTETLQEAYACYTSANSTLTFYYDDLRSTRPGTTYDLNMGTNNPDWYSDGTYSSVRQVVFDPSFANAVPTSAYHWFYGMSDLQSITDMQYLNTSEVTIMYGMFDGCRGLTSLDLSGFNTAKVTNMALMFNNCSSLTSLDLGGFNTTNVANMLNMFYGCSGLTSLDVSSFNSSSVTYMDYMFANCSGLTSLDLINFNTTNVTNMQNMFYNCTGLETIYASDSWSTAAVTSSANMFQNCTSLVGGMGTAYDANHVDAAYAHIDIGTINPGYFTALTEGYACYTSADATLTFYYDGLRRSREGVVYDLNTTDHLPGWVLDDTNDSVTNVVFDPLFADARPTTTYSWFYGMNNLQSITGMSYLNTSEVTNMADMFAACEKLTSLDVSHFNTSKVTTMSDMFYYCPSLTNLDVSNFNTANVTKMRSMFDGCKGLTRLDLSSFNTSRVTDMSWMFYACNNLRTIYVSNDWSTAAVNTSYSHYMFKNCTSLVGGMGTPYNDVYTEKSRAHIDGGSSNPGYLTDINGPEAYACYTPENTTLTFYCDKERSSRPGTIYDLNTGINVPDWDTDGTKSYVTKVVFDPTFAYFPMKTTFKWFNEMGNLLTINGLSYLNTSEVIYMGNMFYGCNKLTSLDLSSFNTSKVTRMGSMFSGCSNLQTIYAGNGWSTAAVSISGSMFYNCTSLVGGQGTAYDASNPKDKTYAHIDGGPDNPGYFTAKNASQRGDVDGDGNVNISDVTALIDYLLSGSVAPAAADCNQDSNVNISDVTALIDYLLSGTWN